MPISQHSKNKSFTTRIATIQKNESLYLADPYWVHFLQDHRSLLITNSTRMTLDLEIMTRYRYRIRDFLIKYGKHADLEQAFRVINRLHDDKDFNERLEYVYIPLLSQIRELRNKYSTVSKRRAKLGIV